MLVMPDSFNCSRLCKCVSTTNRKCHKLFALFLVNIWIVQSCYFVHCLHLPRCLYYTQCHHSMSSFSPLPYLHYLLHHLHRCIIFLLIFRPVIIIVLISITVIIVIDKVFASIYMIFVTVSVFFVFITYFSSFIYVTVFILMGVVLILITVSIILEVSPCSCPHQFHHFTHIFINFSFFSSSVFLLLFFITVFILMQGWKLTLARSPEAS